MDGIESHLMGSPAVDVGPMPSLFYRMRSREGDRPYAFGFGTEQRHGDKTFHRVDSRTHQRAGRHCAAATAATSDCTEYDFVRTVDVAANVTSSPWSYFISPVQGTIEACLDGADGSDYGLILKQFVPGGLATVATVLAGLEDKALDYLGPPSAYRVEVVSDIAGQYTVGVNIP